MISMFSCDTASYSMSPICVREVTERDNSITLEGGDGNSYGNVYAVNNNDYYGPVCDDGLENGSYYGERAANIVCRYIHTDMECP